jgi:hypothetical protein
VVFLKILSDSYQVALSHLDDKQASYLYEISKREREIKTIAQTPIIYNKYQTMDVNKPPSRK